MTKSIPILATALLMTTVATPVFAQAAIQEPGAFAFYHPNAYYIDAAPMRDQRQIAPRHHRRAR